MSKRDFNAIVHQFKSVVETGKFVVLDTETTGLGRQDEIVQIAVVNPDGGALVNTLVQPTVPSAIQPKATEIHGITPQMVIGKPTLLDLQPKLIEHLSNKFIVAYNADFDKRMVSQSATAVGALRVLTDIPCQWVDVMRPYQRLMGLSKWVSLKTACIQQNVVVENEHDALGDSLMLLKLLYRIANM